MSYEPSSSSYVQYMPPPHPVQNVHLSDDFVILEFTRVSFIVYNRTFRGALKSSRQILSELSGVFHGGTITCIMGPSGCGKTTLMNAVAGRMQPGSNSRSSLSLQVSLNGQLVEPVANRKQIGFVQAHETLYPTDTPLEAFTFVAMLKLRKLSSEQRKLKVQEMLTVLRLQNCAGTFLGSPTLKGVSSGEKKRTSVGLELLPEPEILFLDEPTTGLDSVTALELMELLKEFANRGVCIVTVLHQPSPKILDLVNNVIYMTRGFIVYHGPRESVVAYFSSRGYACPPEYNPSDYIMFLLQTLGDGAIADLVEWYRPAMEQTLGEISNRRQLVATGQAVGHQLQPEQRPPVYAQMAHLLRREYRSTMRDKSVLWLRLLLSLIFGTIIGFLFFQVGNDGLGTLNPSHVGLIATLGIFSLVSAGQALVIAFADERPIAIREYSSGLYGIPAYSLSKDVLEYPILLMSVLTYLTLGYLLGGLVGSFLLLVRGNLVHMCLFLVPGNVLDGDCQRRDFFPTSFVSNNRRNGHSAGRIFPCCSNPSIGFLRESIPSPGGSELASMDTPPKVRLGNNVHRGIQRAAGLPVAFCSGPHLSQHDFVLHIYAPRYHHIASPVSDSRALVAL